MYLFDLPVEIGALIFKYVDLKTKIKAYRVEELKKFFVPSLMRKFDVSRSSLASVKTLNHDLFLDLAANINELNLSGITDLTACQLSPHIQRCSNLKTLDITFTSIFLSDLDDICTGNLKNISVNFFKWPRKYEWEKSIDLFQRQRFEYVHVIVHEFDSGFPLLFMSLLGTSTRTKNVKITVADYYNRDLQEYYNRYVPQNLEWYSYIIDANFEHLNYVFRDCSLKCFNGLQCLPGVSNLDYEQIEFILFIYRNEIGFEERSQGIEIYVSPVFSSIFAMNCSELKVVVTSHLLLNNMSLVGHIVLKAWDKSCTEFNNAFIRTVLTDLSDYLPTYLCMHNKTEMKCSQAPSNWHCIDACQGFERILDKLPEKVTLTNFCRKEGRVFRTSDPVYLTQSNTLKNITYLRLTNICLREDFFTALFKQCKSLYTLDVIIEKRDFQRCSLSLSNSMHLTESLKNMRLISGDIEYETYFASLCQCPSLENIEINENERSHEYNIDQQNMVLLIEKCLNLYSLFINVEKSSENITLLKSSMKAAALKLGRDYLFIEVGEYLAANPFGDVFNPRPLNTLT